ncbi:MAG: hypothetical protein MJ010_04100 [Paludibacteraceae bacterium]|nr:hypothetical protein [Paludibacteraceae bacterium]
MKKLISLATLAAMSAFAVSAFAQGTDLPDTQGVCQSSKYQYDTDGLAGYTYLWEITGGTMDTDYKITKSGAGDKTAVVEWLNPTPEGTTWIFTQQARSDKGCLGPVKTVNVSVNTFEVNPVEGDVCSDIPEVPSTVDVSLPTEGKCGGVKTHTVNKWKIVSVVPDANVTGAASNHKAGDELTSATDLNTDKFTNAGTTDANVVYTIIPFADNGAQGASFTVTITVYPEVKKPNVTFKAL